MTEQEWVTCTFPHPMLYFLRDYVSQRKLLLWGVACCRRAWDKLDDPERQHVEATERYADGVASEEECRSFQEEYLSDTPCGIWNNPVFDRGPETRDAGLADLLREVFGNPFRPPVSLPLAVLDWNGGTVRRLAGSIYDIRAFDLLPVLADALEEAGCQDQDILSHCRSGGEHVRGCWVVDLVLGKS